MRLLLDPRVDTPETLRLYPTDPHGKELYLSSVNVPADDLTARSSLQNSNLSQNESLRKIWVTASSID